MIKKTVGIAAILLLILVFAIGISRANTRVAQLEMLDHHDLTLEHVGEVYSSSLLGSMQLLPRLESLDSHLLSADDTVLGLNALRNVPHTNVDLVQLDVDLGLLDVSL